MRGKSRGSVRASSLQRARPSSATSRSETTARSGSVPCCAATCTASASANARTSRTQHSGLSSQDPRLMNRTYAGTLRNEHAGSTVTLCGWVHKQRDFGELVFIDLRDRTGICQVVVDRSRGASDELLATAKELRSEFVVRIDGIVDTRSVETRNAKLATGEVELVASSIEIYNRSETPPFPVEEDVTAAEELRLKHRYLDLRRPGLTQNFILRDRLAFGVRDYMHRQGFLEVETPILTKSTPEGARDYLLPSRVHNGEFYPLPQSPQ